MEMESAHIDIACPDCSKRVESDALLFDMYGAGFAAHADPFRMGKCSDCWSAAALEFQRDHQRKPCRDCRGSGHIPRGRGLNNPNRGRPPRTCEFCHGNGFIEVEDNR